MTRTILHDAALADGSSDSLRLGVSVAIADGKIEAIGANDEVDQKGATVIDAGGAVMPADLFLIHGDARALWRVWAVFQAGTRVA